MRVEFFDLKRVGAAQEIFLSACPQGPLGLAEVPLLEAAGRVLGAPVPATEDLPAFHRSTVDGYAVRAEDTFGASEGLPAYLRVAEDIPMGRPPSRPLGAGDCARIATGGMLPEGADAVVMVEHTEMLSADEAAILRPTSPWQNVMRRGEDCATGKILLPAGTLLRPQEVGLLAHAGILAVPAARRPSVAILATGDELVAPYETPGPGQIRESNSYTVQALVAANGALPVFLGRVRDNAGAIWDKLVAGVEQDVLVVMGGSSVGARDLTAGLLDRLGPPGILVHGVSLRPAKPTILGLAGTKPVIGLPGNPVSAQIAYYLFVQPLLRQLLGLPPFTQFPPLVRARLTKNVASAPGRVDVLRVALVQREGETWAEPVHGKSGLISTLTRAGGMVVVDENQEGLLAGEWVGVLPV